MMESEEEIEGDSEDDEEIEGNWEGEIEIEGDSEDDGEKEIERDLEHDCENSEEYLMGHMVDYLFDEESLEWIEKNYGNSMNFMYSYGLKFYDNNDCREAQNIAHVMAKPDESP